ncbi:MAG: hypothetical protein PF482_10110 [Desulfobacteraceae bacterium]|jgi:CBS domain-containing membrane protein|nr:hypothetical protein [Desulfobacteraceae bacterium]
MKKISGYVDITPAGFKEIYGLAYHHALDRLGQSVTAENIMTNAVISVNPEGVLDCRLKDKTTVFLKFSKVQNSR